MSLVDGFNAVMTPLIGYMVDASGSFITSIILMVAVQAVALVGTVGFITQRRLTGGRLS
jgi:cyanate permease